MRQLGSLASEQQARQLAAWLTTQRIEAHAEQEAAGWVIWVREEDQLPKAREALAHYREHPDDPRYQNAERAANTMLREEDTKRRQAQKNVVEMRGRWTTAGGMPGQPRRAPFTMALIGLSILTAIATYNDTMVRGKPRPLDPIYRALLFADPLAHYPGGGFDMWVSIRAGQVWRLVTPIFIHYGWSHLIFNMLFLYSFGSSVEDRRGSLFFLLLVVALAALSNCGQVIEQTVRGHFALFGGMSGVDYGLLGYLWVKTRFDSREPYFLSPGTTFIAILWLVLCILGDIPPFDQMLPETLQHVANGAHVVGLLAGAAIAYVPLLARRPA
jgi:GlpG protein